MKQLYFCSSEFPPGPGGIGNHAYNLAIFLSKEKFSVVVITRGANNLSEVDTFDASLGFPVLRFSRQGGRLVAQVLKTLQKTDRDSVVIASGRVMLVAVGVASWLFPAVRQCAKIAVVHGTDILPEKRWLRWFVHRLLNRFNRIIAVSNYTALKIPDQVKPKVTIINNGFNAGLFPSPITGRRRRSSGFSLVTVGSVTERKGQLNVIQALPLLRKKIGAVNYHMVGLPKISNVVRNEALRLGVDQEVVIHGALQHDKLVAILNQSDVFIMLSEDTPGGSVEGFGIAVIEANALGLPAIGSRGTGLEDAIRHGYSGLLVDPHVPESICDAVEAIGNRYEEFSSNAIRHAMQFSWQYIGQRYLQEVEGLVQQKKYP